MSATGNGKLSTGALALIALVTLLVGVIAAGPASGDPVANTAKKSKKCKKKGKKASNAKKKKKCKKKKQNKETAPPAPVVRATLTWTNADADDADLDLFVFDAQGKVAGNGSDAIPQSTLSPDVTGKNGTETFTDNLFTPQAARDFSFGVCYKVGGSAHAPFTLTYVTADGQSHTVNEDPGSTFHYEYTAGPAIPSNYCPA